MSDIVNEVKKTYELIAPYFSRTRAELWPEMEKYQQKLKDGQKVLDLGCGNGRLVKGLDREINYLGVDFCEKLIGEAKKLFPSYKFVVGDVLDDGFWKKKKKYDVIFAVALLHHIPNRQQQLKLLKKMKEHLNKGGWIYISVWNLWKRKFWLEHIRSWRLKMKNWRWVMIPFQHKTPCFYTGLDKKYLEGLVKEGGFKIRESFYTGKKRNLVVIAE